MNTLQTPALRRNKFLEKTGLFFFILTTNLALLSILGSLVIYKIMVTREEEPMTFVKVKKEEVLKQKPPPKGGEATKSLADPSVTVVPPPVSISSAIADSNVSVSFNMTTTPTSLSTLALPTFAAPPLGSGLESGSTGGGSPHSNPFGNTVDDSAGAPLLTGYMFDLKQTPDKKPTRMVIGQFYRVLQKFVSMNFNEELLGGYYRTQDALGVGAIDIPRIPSTEAPKAFHVENEVQASLWAVHYHALVIAPEEGNYTFAGAADNVIVVAMDRKLLLDAGMNDITHESSIRIPLSDQHFKGRSFHAEGGQQFQMDVLIADDGGGTHFSLYLTKEGDSYQTGSLGVPVMPFFRLNTTSGLDSPVKCPPWVAGAAQ